MPSRKQRRRRQKDRRHEYEYVYLDEEGQEVAVEDMPAPSRNGGSGDRRAEKPPRTGRGRTAEPASWGRALRRGLLFAPFMFGILYVLNGDEVPLTGLVLNTLMLLAFFVPFGYLMDKFMYRAFERRAGSDVRKPRR